MNFVESKIKIFTGNANKNLAEKIVDELQLKMGQSIVTTFSDGEISVSIKESVRGCDCFVVQPTCFPVNTNIMELLIMIDGLKRASAGRITAIIPYFGYARQDRKTKARDPISAKLCANLITAAGADRILTMDLHAAQIQGFFDIPLDHLRGIPVMVEHLKQIFSNEKTDDVVVVAPDIGSVTLARSLAEKLDTSIAIVEKRRQKANVCEVLNIIGNVENKTIIMSDDMIDTAGTLCNAAKALIEIGKAKKIYACATHGVLSGPAIDRIEKSYIEKLIVTDTIPLSEKKLNKIKVLSVAKIFAKAIEKIHNNESVSYLLYLFSYFYYNFLRILYYTFGYNVQFPAFMICCLLYSKLFLYYIYAY